MEAGSYAYIVTTQTQRQVSNLRTTAEVAYTIMGAINIPKKRPRSDVERDLVMRCVEAMTKSYESTNGWTVVFFSLTPQ